MTWLVVLAVGAGSFALRVGPLLLLSRRPLSARSDRIVRHAGAAALASLVATSTQHSASGGAVVPTLAAVAVALVLALRGASMPRLLAAGGAAYAAIALAGHLLAR